ncbi:MAG: prolyl oligopeptidase family serine peptidase [Bacteroidales bacterium]
MKRQLILTISIFLFAMVQHVASQIQTKEKATIVRKTTLNYLLRLPSDYKNEKNTTYPILIFLHGSGERGDSIELVKRNGPPSFIENQLDFPFIMVSPQCPEGTWWVIEDLQVMLEQMLAKYRIDRNRIYLTGLSMGGFGTWAWASKYPEQFAAIAPVCGGGDIQFAKKFTDLPVWAFHGEADPVVPVKRTIEMVEAVNASGGSARMTIYPAVGHDSWIQAYNDAKLFEWLLEHSRK